MKLSDIMADTKSVWVGFDPIPGFEVEINYIPRTRMTAIVNSCQKVEFDKRTRGMEKTLDEGKFISKFVGEAVSGWKGLTVAGLEILAPVKTGSDPKEEIEYTAENAVFLVKQSSLFDEWVNDKISDVDSFRDKGKGKTDSSAD